MPWLEQFTLLRSIQFFILFFVVLFRSSSWERFCSFDRENIASRAQISGKMNNEFSLRNHYIHASVYIFTSFSSDIYRCEACAFACANQYYIRFPELRACFLFIVKVFFFLSLLKCLYNVTDCMYVLYMQRASRNRNNAVQHETRCGKDVCTVFCICAHIVEAPKKKKKKNDTTTTNDNNVMNWQ